MFLHVNRILTFWLSQTSTILTEFLAFFSSSMSNIAELALVLHPTVNLD